VFRITGCYDLRFRCNYEIQKCRIVISGTTHTVTCTRTHTNAFTISFPLIYFPSPPLIFPSLHPPSLSISSPLTFPPSLLPSYPLTFPLKLNLHPSLPPLSLTGSVALWCGIPRALCHLRRRRTELAGAARTSHRPSYSSYLVIFVLSCVVLTLIITFTRHIFHPSLVCSCLFLPSLCLFSTLLFSNPALSSLTVIQAIGVSEATVNSTASTGSSDSGKIYPFFFIALLTFLFSSTSLNLLTFPLFFAFPFLFSFFVPMLTHVVYQFFMTFYNNDKSNKLSLISIRSKTSIKLKIKSIEIKIEIKFRTKINYH
jgi:hypothetical protein